jgi:DNA-binding response OmpR family regulator
MVGAELSVVITDDDPGCRDLFEHWLCEECAVETASDGEALLSTLSADVDVVLLDREMPGPSGTEVARRIAASPHDPHVVMVSSRRVELDLVDVPIDGYVRKPAQAEDLEKVVRDYRRRQEYESALEDFFALTAKLAAIEADADPADLATDERYRRLRWLVEEQRCEVDMALDRSRSDWSVTFRSLAPTPGADATCRRV